MKNNKKILLITLVVLTIIMMSSVSAADQTINPNTSGGLKKAIVNADNGDTIYMKNGDYFGKDNTNLSISKSITIVGKGSNIVIDAKGKSSIFNINHRITVTLKNLKLINSQANVNYGLGGAIDTEESNLSVSDCTFTNNQANEGGAIKNRFGSLSVSNCIFTNNQAKTTGGAICSYGPLSVSGCTFTNNQAGDAGAIYTVDKSFVHDSTFTNNQATGNNTIGVAIGFGGAIHTQDDSLSVSDCTFTNNQAYEGGAIKGNTVTVSKSTFTDNQAKNGGGISVYGILRLDSVNFKNNIAGSKYNAIHLESKAKIYKNKVTITPTENSPITSDKKADLTIAKITKKGNYCYITIKNIGKKNTDNKFYLGIYYGKKQIKQALVNSLDVDKSTTVKVSIPTKYKNKLKTFKTDNTNSINEINEKNNSHNAR